ncbi:hypothetical protein D9615_008348 [Tricholomella constricta]|uniref:Uncharacterized protein n=1 Tax=Tricholomella constricta TaxID=117010 RepID=A0A8H5HD52_9AGAR|nr:hypothetical protein D9615_008348 [Tricholomella constricta]
MSSISGTQSPPLEATGEDKPMGASSVDTVGEKIEVVEDTEQRKQYFQEPSPEREAGQTRPEKTGESKADKLQKQT